MLLGWSLGLVYLVRSIWFDDLGMVGEDLDSRTVGLDVPAGFVEDV